MSEPAVAGYAIVLARRASDGRLVRCGVKIDVPRSMVFVYQRRALLHAMTIRDSIPPGLAVEWCSEWRRGVYSKHEPLGGWQ